MPLKTEIKYEELDSVPEIKKNEVIQETNFYKEIKKYEGKEESGKWKIIIAIILAAAVIMLLI
ncbi:MAG: hypothetical protein PHT91_03910 [Candidatus Nanoarchaeia archaeon]|nr:hypothetical protein [Candidatus Nanoarchaeia archaeon]MDD5499990.1 hypothetical protein [Candidatus Nanoarchaeia archaeon]